MVCASCDAIERASNRSRALVTSTPLTKRALALGTAIDDRRPVNENKALSALSARNAGRGGARGRGNKTDRETCDGCRAKTRDGYTLCNACAFRRAACARCGKAMMDVTMYNGHAEADEGERRRRERCEAVGLGVRDRRDVSTDDLEEEERARSRAKTNGEEEEKGEEAPAATPAPAPTPLAGPTSAAEVAREMGQAARGGPVSGWRFDAASGYYYDVAAQVYFDEKTGGYFDCKTQKWTMPAAKTAAELQTGRATGKFTDGTRKPDRFGL